MINELIELAKTQPILVGGVGTVATSAILYTIRAIPSKIISGISSSLISTLFVDSQNDYYSHINNIVFKYRIRWSFRSYEPSENSTDEEGFPNTDEKKILIPGYGTGYGIWRGILFSFYKDREDKGQKPIKRLKIRLYTRSEKKINEFFEEASKFGLGDPIQRIYTSNGNYWERRSDRKLRSLDTVFLNYGIKETIVNGLEDFLNNEDWFIKRGVHYKFCVLLYGPPGTGKTSLIHAIASKFELDINYVTRLGSLSHLLSSRNIRPSVTVIEDIDTLVSSLKRDDEQEDNHPNPVIAAGFSRREAKSDKFKDPELILHDLLNSLDGLMSNHGSIVFVTSNFPERLDKALVRPGRIDLAVEIGPLNFEAASFMFNAFFGEQYLETWRVALENSYKPMIGAQLQEIFMRNSPQESIRILQGHEKIN